MKTLFKKNTKETREINLNNTTYKVKIVYEKRNNSRVSITKTGINMRIVNFISRKEQEIQIQKFLSWAKTTILEKQVSFKAYQRSFSHGEVLKLYDIDIVLNIYHSNNEKLKGKSYENSFVIHLPKNVQNNEKNKSVSKMIAKLLAATYKIKIENKLNKFNAIHQFGVLNTVRLKNNSTNWGSCSSKNNINISVRLFLAPEWVVDYVLIHELVHLKHRNHSINFWNEVSRAYPKYKEAEMWLKANAKSCII